MAPAKSDPDQSPISPTLHPNYDDPMRSTLKVLFAIAVLIALPAAAADNGFYIGASVGQAAVATGELGDEGDLDIDIDSDSTGYKVFGGFRALTFLGVEGAYFDLGSSEDADAEVAIDGLSLSVVGYIPLGIADIFGKAGMMSWNTEFSGSVDGDPLDVSSDGTDPVYGAGFQFRFQSFCIRGEVEYFDVEAADEIIMYSVGGSYTF